MMNGIGRGARAAAGVVLVLFCGCFTIPWGDYQEDPALVPRGCDAGPPDDLPFAVGVACNVHGGNVCDGIGNCLPCLRDRTPWPCPAGEVCSTSNTCVHPRCTDGMKSGDETDIDCGGGGTNPCPRCAEGKTCLEGGDCESQVCTKGTCALPGCTDHVKNGDETDVDCGGATCPKCLDGSTCLAATDCESGVCAGTCLPPSCTDGAKNGSEADIDCGGGGTNPCPRCAEGKTCLEGGDCESQVCTKGTCALPGCTDHVKNGDETDVDCGGQGPMHCPACLKGKNCSVDADCKSGVCSGTCQPPPPTCTDGATNGSETDIDCGGACPKCLDGSACLAGTDCQSGVCDVTCQPPTCTDGVTNGSETDIDCGGACPGCAVGSGCVIDTDCGTAAVCTAGACAPSPGTLNLTASPANGTAGSSTLTVDSATGFSAGQEVLIHQTQGTGAGSWEQATIASVAGSVLTFTAPLSHTYTSTGTNNHAQVVVVEQYTTLDVPAGTALLAPVWNGSTGGILAVHVTGAMTVEGRVSMAGRGYRGTVHRCTSGGPTYTCKDGFSGESPFGPGSQGVANNGPGGGGGARGQDCGMGAAGSYGTAGQKGTNGTHTMGNCSAISGNSPAGSTIGDPDLTSAIFFGGAGGEGGADEDGAYPGKGGDGGGIIFIEAGTLTVTGQVTVDGGDGGNGVQNAVCGGSGCGMSGGGAGAGGAVRIIATTADLGSGLVTSNGGNGGKCTCATSGAAGGRGRIAVQAGTVNGSTTPTYFGG